MQRFFLFLLLNLNCINPRIQNSKLTIQAENLKLIEGDNFLIYINNENRLKCIFVIINKNKDTLKESWFFSNIDSNTNLTQIHSSEINRQFNLAKKFGLPRINTEVYLIKGYNKITKINGDPYIDLKVGIFKDTVLQPQHLFLKKQPKDKDVFHFIYNDMFNKSKNIEYVYLNDFWIIAYTSNDYIGNTNYIQLKWMNDRTYNFDSILRK